MDPAVRFAALVGSSPERVHLDHACALMAAAFTGEDHHAAVTAELDAMAARCRTPTLDGVLAVMRPRLTGARDDYYDPRNSFVDVVLERGVGLPITLSVIAIEIGRRVSAPIVGIGLPSHFIVGDVGAGRYGDPYHDGVTFDRDGLIERWTDLVGEGTPFDDRYLAPVDERSILIRMLNNLRAVYSLRNDPHHMYALAVMRGGFPELAHEAPQHARWVRHLN